MPSGDMKPVKVPVSKNMLDSHIREELSRKGGRMVTVAIKDAQVWVLALFGQTSFFLPSQPCWLVSVLIMILSLYYSENAKIYCVVKSLYMGIYRGT